MKKKNGKKYFKFTRKHFIIASVLFALVILGIYLLYKQKKANDVKDANNFAAAADYPSEKYYWKADEKAERENSWRYEEPNGKFTATTHYKADDLGVIHLRRVTEYVVEGAETPRTVTEYGALVRPDKAHSKEVFNVINKSGLAHFGTEVNIYKQYGKSVQEAEKNINNNESEAKGQDGARFLFWADKPTGHFEFVGIVSIGHIVAKNKSTEGRASDEYVRNISYSFGKKDFIKAKGAALYAAWAYVDALLYFEIPSEKENLKTTKLFLSMNKDNTSSIKIAKRLGFELGGPSEQQYDFAYGQRDQRAQNENMEAYILKREEWRKKYETKKA